jgi:tetratricopeptide (TPR) repeat protein
MGQLVASASAPSTSSAVVNPLIGAAADPEPIVRIAAVRSLAAFDDARVLPVMAAHLTDPSRVVRVSAAEGLLAHGVARLDGAAGEALAKAQDEWAESLRTFNDLPADHTTLGWLMASRGRSSDGESELKTAVTLDPRDPRPHVYLGVLAARAERYDEALRQWRQAQALAPAYPNLDRLIAEAQNRSKKN